MNFLDKFTSLLPFPSKKDSQEFFFALNITSSEVEGAVWGIERNKLILINTAKASLKQYSLLEAANLTLDEALADFQPEPTKILFGVPDSWLLDDNLKDEHAKDLKELVKELDVEPLAYVSSSHAISHLLQKQQGVPLTAILVELADPLVVAVVKGGKVVSTKSKRRDESLAGDIEKCLMGVDEVEVLPSKIYLFGSNLASENTEKLKDELHGFSWMQNLPFLHLPKVEFLKENLSIAAIAFAGGSELNPNIIFNEHSLERVNQINVEHREGSGLKELPKDEVSRVIPDISDKGRHKPNASDANLEEVGFMSGDIEDVKSHKEDLDFEEEEINPEIDQRALVNSKHHPPATHHPENNQAMSVFNQITSKALAPLGMFGSLPQGSKGLPIGRNLIILIVVLVGIFAAFIFLPKATVTLFIDPKILEKDAQVTVDPTVTAVDEANKKIPGKIVQATLTGTEKGQATGKKQIGDPAKGTVNVYNLTSNKVSLSQGTVITSSSGVKFTLDSSLQIASQSATVGADFTTVTTPGKANSGVTAAAIGPDGNLPAGTALNVSGYTQQQVAAKVDSALSGGTSKDVTVVTSDDQKKVLAVATSNLRLKAKDQLQSQLSGDFKILTEGLSEENVKASYSKKVNDQATDFTINLSINFKGTAYADTDLKTMVSKLVETNVPPGYLLNLQDAQTQADVGKLEKNGNLIFLAKFRAKLTPKYDLDKVKDQIKGKSPDEAAAILKNLESVISSEIKISPSMPGPLRRLPMLAKNITIKVTTK